MRLPFVAPPAWWVGAQCRREQIPLSTFFSRDDIPVARAVCESCLVRLRCLSEHLNEPFGVWGGHTTSERERIGTLVAQGTTIGDASQTLQQTR